MMHHTKEKKYTHDHVNRCKQTDKTQYLVIIFKNTEYIGNIRNISQYIKG